MKWGEAAFSGNTAVIFSSGGVFVVRRGGGAVTAGIPIASGNAVRSVVRYRDGDSERLFVDFGEFHLLDPETGESVKKDPPLRIQMEPLTVRLRVGRGSGLVVRAGDKPACYFVVSAGEESYISCLLVQTLFEDEIHNYLRVLLWSQGTGAVVLESDTRIPSEFPPIDLAGGTIAVVTPKWAFPMANLASRGVLNAIRGTVRYGSAETCTLSSNGQAMACMVRDFSSWHVRAVWVDLSWLARQTTPPPADQQSIRVSSLYLPEELGNLSPHQIRPIRIAPTLDWGVVEITDGEGQSRTFAPVEFRWEDLDQPSDQRG